MIYTLFIAPLVLIIEVLFVHFHRLFGNAGISVICLSFAVSLLIAPLYRRADALQEAEREKQKEMADRVAKIRKAFRGDVRFMMLQTYYRQCDYKPYYVLRSSLSLLLQVPFFIAAYRFLSNLRLLNGASFSFIGDLGAPDALLSFGEIRIHLLPLLMTAVNLLSGIVYLRGALLREKIQVLAVALIFLLLLYERPSGLVLYWTCNNLFSLGKNLAKRFLQPQTAKKILHTLLVLAALALMLFVNQFYGDVYLRSTKAVLTILLFFLSLLPLIRDCLPSVWRRFFPHAEDDVATDELRRAERSFLLFCLLFTVVTGLLIPSAVIASSPEEFLIPGQYRNPFLTNLVPSFLLAAGLFLLWAQVLYRFSPEKTRVFVSRLAFPFGGAFLINYFFFGSGYGNLSSALVYDRNDLSVTPQGKLINLMCFAAVLLVLFLFARLLPRFVTVFQTALLVSVVFLTLTQIIRTGQTLAANNAKERFSRPESASETTDAKWTLSQNGRNVIVIMLDRAIASFVPYLFEELPQLNAQFDGFTYYPNTVSHGAHTMYGAPGLYGGYEYTPYEMNRRADELLPDKHDESLMVLPVLFGEAGAKVFAYDQPLTGYLWTSNMSIYDDLPYVTAGNLRGYYTATEVSFYQQELRERNFFCYSFMRLMPVALQQYAYDLGSYFSTRMDGFTLAPEFAASYPVLELLSFFTGVTQDTQDTLTIIDSDATHGPTELQLPDYTLSFAPDNHGFNTSERTDAAGNVLDLSDVEVFRHYCVNAACLMRLGEWFDQLREQGVYDNTRIIIVSDHGYNLHLLPEKPEMDATYFNALFLVKDFDAQGFTTDPAFMTVADTPFLASRDMIENAANPFTGVPFSPAQKKDVQIIYNGHEIRPQVFLTETQFPVTDNTWWTVRENVFLAENWEVMTQ
ncbi:MAG: YidC/Oxa1 family membrane protein insertase [Lachnospiraceae bacterium]|nr:YidC/Oxa1 family membrane protein insertase [Lachnospiraceae bacterium]